MHKPALNIYKRMNFKKFCMSTLVEVKNLSIRSSITQNFVQNYSHNIKLCSCVIFLLCRVGFNAQYSTVQNSIFPQPRCSQTASLLLRWLPTESTATILNIFYLIFCAVLLSLFDYCSCLCVRDQRYKITHNVID